MVSRSLSSRPCKSCRRCRTRRPTACRPINWLRGWAAATYPNPLCTAIGGGGVQCCSGEGVGGIVSYRCGVAHSHVPDHTSVSVCASASGARMPPSARAASASSARAGARGRSRRHREDRRAPPALSRGMTHPVGSRLSALGSRLFIRLCSRLSALSLLSASATACRGPVRPSICRRHAPRGTPPSHSRGRYPRLHRGHRPSAARRGIGPSPPPGGRAVSRPTRPWCAVTASLVAYPAGRSHRLNRVRAHRRGSPFHAGNIIQRNSTKANSYNFTTSIGIPRTACKSDEYQPSRSD